MGSFGASVSGGRRQTKRHQAGMSEWQQNQMPKDPIARIELMKSLKRLVELKRSTNPDAGTSRNPINFEVLRTKACSHCGEDFVYTDADTGSAHGATEYCKESCRDAAAIISAGASNKTMQQTKARVDGNRRRVAGYRLYARIAKGCKDYVCSWCQKLIPTGENHANQNVGRGKGHLHLDCYKLLLAQAAKTRKKLAVSRD